jgi:hypothetical protein
MHMAGIGVRLASLNAWTRTGRYRHDSKWSQHHIHLLRENNLSPIDAVAHFRRRQVANSVKIRPLLDQPPHGLKIYRMKSYGHQLRHHVNSNSNN